MTFARNWACLETRRSSVRISTDSQRKERPSPGLIAKQAVCGPSHNSIMTGIHPDQLEIWGMSSRNRINWRDERPGVTSLPEQFRNHGYRAIGFGKIYD